jgi:hypothetical protein
MEKDIYKEAFDEMFCSEDKDSFCNVHKELIKSFIRQNFIPKQAVAEFFLENQRIDNRQSEFPEAVLNLSDLLSMLDKIK